MTASSLPTPDFGAAALEGGERRRRRRVLLSLGAALLGLPLLAGFWLTQPLVRTRVVTGVPAVSEARLRADVERLSVDFRPRDHRHPANLDRVADHVAEAFRAAGGRVTEQVFEVPGCTTRNVSARFGPEAGARVMVGAHYDAYRDLPAADDNASGVAGLLELARILGERPPAGPVELVAYSLEEPPHFGTGDMGSAHHARALRTSGAAVTAMLSLEMIGFFSDEPGSQAFPVPFVGALYPDRGSFIAVVGRLGDGGLVRRVKGAMRGAAPLDVRSMTAPRSVPGIDFSDHHPYWDAGFPAVMITDGAFFRNRAYHTEGDTADRLDYHRMAQVVQGVWGAVQALSEPAPR